MRPVVCSSGTDERKKKKDVAHNALLSQASSLPDLFNPFLSAWLFGSCRYSQLLEAEMVRESDFRQHSYADFPTRNQAR